MNRIVAAFAATAAIALTGCETLEQTYTEATSSTYTAELSGANEVHRGDPDGSGEAEISFADELTRVCWISTIWPISARSPVRISIVEVPEVDGPVVLALKQATESGWRGCSSDTAWVQRAFDEGLSNYYVNVHTAEYPNGAIRGQLRQ